MCIGHKPGVAVGHGDHCLWVRGTGAHRSEIEPSGAVRDESPDPSSPVRRAPRTGPPKRFAQGIGAVFSLTAFALALSGLWTAAQVVLGLLAAAAFLESGFGLCLGCKAFALLMRAGVIPVEVCEDCNNIWAAGRRQQ